MNLENSRPAKETGPYTFTWEARQGIYKVILYAKTADKSIADWKVNVKDTSSDKSDGQSNAVNTVVPCKTGDDKSSGKDSFEFLCDERLAAKEVIISWAGASTDGAELAEVVVVGKPWASYPCGLGYYKAGTGLHSDVKGSGCTPCENGFRDKRGATFAADSAANAKECQTCAVANKDIYFTKDIKDKQQAKCKVCAAPTVILADKGTCVKCPAGKEYFAEGTGNCNYLKGEALKTAREKETVITVTTPDDCTKVICQDCPVGYLNKAESTKYCHRCPKKSEYTDDKTTCKECPAGKVRNDVGNACKDCEAGTKRAQGEAECTACQAGWTSIAGQAACKKCGAGEYEKEKKTCEKCPIGKYNALEGQSGPGSCKDCEAGTVAITVGLAACKECTPGFYAPAAKDQDCKACEVAKVQPSKKMKECTVCEAGKVPNSGRTVCETCPAGKEYYAEADSDTTNCDYLTGDALKNARKTATPVSVTKPDTCKKVEWKDCPAGTRNPLNSVNYCHRCTKDKEYTTDKINCKDCPNGQVANSVGDACTNCEAGKKRASTDDTCKQCEAGSKSAAGDSACTDCPAGQYETAGQTKCEPCPVGKFNAATKQSGLDKCQDCSGGSIAKTTGLSSCEKCEGGKEANGDRTACKDCAEGKFRGKDEADGCKDCAQGTYSNSKVGYAVCTKCELGKYQGTAGQSTCDECPMGKYSDAVGATECKACKSGHVTRQKGKAKCEPCKPGEKSNGGLTDCEKCPMGQHSETEGSSECKACKSGHVTRKVGEAKCEPCQPGYKSNSGLTDCVKCVAGEFQDQTGQGTCKKCPSNMYSNEVGAKFCLSCTENKYSLEGQTSCKQCPRTNIEEEMVKIAGIDDGNHIAVKKCKSDALGNVCAAATYNNQYGNFSHDELKLDQSSEKLKNPCKYDKDPVRYAIFVCRMDGAGKMNVVPSYECQNTQKTSEISDIATSSKTEKQKAEKLEDLTEDTATNGIGDVEAVSKVLDSIGISDKAEASTTKKINETMTKSILNAVSNLVDSDLKVAKDKTTSASQISGGVVNQMVNVAKQTTVKSKMVNSPRVAVIDIEKGKNVEDKPKKKGVIAFTLPEKNQRNNDLKDCKAESSGEKNANTILLIETKKGSENEEVDMAVVLITDATLMPDAKLSVLKKEEAATDEGTVENILKSLKKDMNDTTKTDSGPVKQTFVNSFITEVKVENQPPDFKLNLFMKPTIDIGDTSTSLDTEKNGKRVKVGYECASYNPVNATWNKDCKTVYNTAKPGDGVLCLCDHNTSFAVLMSAYEVDRGYAKVQSYLTYVLLGFSTVGLFLTLVFLLPAKALRSTRSAKINICFTIALLLSSLMFLIQDAFINAEDTGVIKLKSTGCAVYAMIQHYLWLVVFVWMVVEGFLMYLSLVQVFGSHISKYMLKFNLAAWGIPLPIPFIGYFVFTKSHTVGSFTFTDHGYLADTMCFIKPESIPFYALFLAPIILVILVNLVFFALVAKVIKNSKSSGNVSDQEQILRQLKAAVGVMVLLGTGWFFGIFMSLPAPQFQVGMQYLFILLNSTQGIFVFLFYIVLNDQVKTHWLVKMGLQEEKRTTTSSSAAGKSAATKVTAVSVSASPNHADNIYENAAASNEEHTYASAEYATASDKAGKHEFPVKSDNNANI